MINKNKILLLACSSDKDLTPEPMPASDRYTGSLFRVGLTIAEEKGWHVLILSAKFGFIEKTTLIPYYNQRLQKAYQGDYPDGSGFYLGGIDYFGNAPERFKPLVEPASIGKMVQASQFLLKDPGLRSGRGVVATLYKELVTGKRTKQELKLLLRSTFPNGHPKMEKLLIFN